MIYAALYLKHRKATKSNVTIYNLFNLSLISLYVVFSSKDMTEKILENDPRIPECLKIR